MVWKLIDETTPKDSREVLAGWQDVNNPLKFFKFVGFAYPDGISSPYFTHAKPTHWHEMVEDPMIEVEPWQIPQVCPSCFTGENQYEVVCLGSHISVMCHRCGYRKTYLQAKNSHA